MGTKALDPLTNSGMVYLGMGEYDNAMDLFERAVAAREMWFMLTCMTPICDRMRELPRFVELVRSIGLPYLG